MATVAERMIRRVLKARGFESRMVNTSVGAVHVLSHQNRVGRGTIAFLHGFGASSAQLAPLLLRVAPYFESVIAYDLPGHGFSDIPDPLDEGTMEAGLREMLEGTLDRPAVIFGNSMGGFAAIRFALLRPDLVDRLVLCSPGGAAMTDRELDALRDIFRIQRHRDAVAFIDRLFARRSRLRHLYALGVRRKLMDDRLQRLLGSVTPDSLLTAEELSELDSPALLLWGRQDEILPRSGLEFFRAHLASKPVRIEEIEGFGHSPHLEAPDRVAEKILEFRDHA